MILTREQKQKVLLDYLCYNQLGEYACGIDENNNSTTIQWVDCRSEWQITDNYNDEIKISYESGGCERAVSRLDDEILSSMIDDLYSPEELDEMFEESA